MDKLSNLKPAAGATKKRKRIGRGQGSGHGGTSTKGNNGAQARTGYSSKRGFEGGQMPLARRVPKFGFTPPNRVEYSGINVQRLEELAGKGRISGEVTPELLYAIGAVSKRNQPIKILGNGALTVKLKVSAHKFSETGKQKILAAGGEVVVV
jgi:large subunit ribosomal protein L15